MAFTVNDQNFHLILRCVGTQLKFQPLERFGDSQHAQQYFWGCIFPATTRLVPRITVLVTETNRAPHSAFGLAWLRVGGLALFLAAHGGVSP